jgi:hypothetical protein
MHIKSVIKKFGDSPAFDFGNSMFARLRPEIFVPESKVTVEIHTSFAVFVEETVFVIDYSFAQHQVFTSLSFCRIGRYQHTCIFVRFDMGSFG